MRRRHSAIKTTIKMKVGRMENNKMTIISNHLSVSNYLLPRNIHSEISALI